MAEPFDWIASPEETLAQVAAAPAPAPVEEPLPAPSQAPEPSFTSSGTWAADSRGFNKSFSLPSFKRRGASSRSKRSGESSPRRRKGSKAPIALVLILALLAAGGLYYYKHTSGGTKPVSPVAAAPAALVLSMTKGQSTEYRMDMTFHGTLTIGGNPTPVTEHLSQSMAWRVVSVDKSGVATVELRTSNGELTVNSKTFHQPALTMQIRVAKDGRILTGADLGTTSGSNAGPGVPGMDQFTPLLPDNPVRPGDSWTKAFDQAFPFGTGQLHFTSHNRLLRYETVNGVRAAVIQSTMSIPIKLSLNLRKLFSGMGLKGGQLPSGSNPTMSFDGSVDLVQTAWLDPARHSLQKSHNVGQFHLTMRFVGFPRSQVPPGGQLGFDGTLLLDLVSAHGVNS